MNYGIIQEICQAESKVLHISLSWQSEDVRVGLFPSLNQRL